jgi:hypothetical protein
VAEDKKDGKVYVEHSSGAIAATVAASGLLEGIRQPLWSAMR